MTTGDKIRKVRKEKGMTQKELGRACGMADSAIRKYESGVITPKVGTLNKLATALDVPLMDLLPNESSLRVDPEAVNKYVKMMEESPVLSRIMPDSRSLNNVINNILKIEDKLEKDQLEALIESYEKLNDKGKREARKRVEELTQISHYTEIKIKTPEELDEMFEDKEK